MRSERIDFNAEEESGLDKGPLVYNDEGDIISGGVEDVDDMSDDGATESCDEVVSNFGNAMAMFSEEVVNRLREEPEYYQKAVSAFTKSLDTIKNSKSEPFKSALFSFTKEVNHSVKKGRKKTSRRINVQSTAKSRRLYKARGNSSKKGRPPTIILPKKRSSEIVSHCLPKFKKVRKSHPHSLSKSVSANRAAEKKH